MKILVVDDQIEILELLMMLLEKEGYYVFPAHDGKKALQIASNIEKLDLVVSDLQMPGINGIEFARRFREIHPETFIIFFSSFVDAKNVFKDDFEAIKNNVYIEKNFSHLVDTINVKMNQKK